MLTEVMEHFRLVKEFPKAGYYESDYQKQMFKDIKFAIHSGKLVAITGIIGCGKTTTLRRLFDVLEKFVKILVSKSLSVDKDRATLPTLIAVATCNTNRSNLHFPTLSNQDYLQL